MAEEDETLPPGSYRNLPGLAHVIDYCGGLASDAEMEMYMQMRLHPVTAVRTRHVRINGEDFLVPEEQAHG